MSELQLRLLLKAEAAQASAALRQAATEVQGLGAAAKAAAADGQAAATGTKALGMAAAQADVQVAGLESELAALKAEAAQASAALRQAATEVQGLGAAAKTAAADGQAAATGTKALGMAAAQADAQVAGLKSELAALKAQLDSVGASEVAAGNNATEMAAKIRTLEAALGRGGRSGGTGAAGAVGNLTAQFNDIGVMMMAGQNPLQLAIQQGTQITQVIGPMGAGGAVRALGSAFMSMLNPVSLVTMGVIAGGAALVQWSIGAMGAGQNTKDFQGNLDGLTAAVSNYRALADLAATSTADLEERFGSAGTEAQRVAAALSDFARVDALRKLDGAVASLSTQFGGLSQNIAGVNYDGSARITELQATVENLREEFNLTDAQTTAVVRSLEGLANARTMGEKIAAADALNQSFIQDFGTVDAIPLPLFEAARNAGLLALEAAKIGPAIGPATAALRELIEAERTLRTEQVERAVEAAAARQEDAAWAQGQLESLAQQSNLMALIGQYGSESAEVSAFRAAAERDVFAAMLETRDLTEAQKNELMVSYDVMVLMTQTSIAGTVGAGADEAARLSGNMAVALSFAQQLAMVQAATPEAPAELGFGPGASPTGGTGVTLGFGSMRGSVFPAPRSPGGGGGRSPASGGGGSTAPARDGLAGLQAEAAAALAGLDLAVAGIAEKVRAGLMSSAEGADAVDSATRRAAEGIATLIPKIERIGPAGIAVASDLRGSMMGLVADLRSAGSDLSASLSGSFKGAFASFLSGAKSGQDAFAAFGDFIKDKIAEILAERFTSQFVTPLFDSILGAVGLGATPAVLGSGAAPAVLGSGAGPAVLGTGAKAGSAAGLTHLSSYSNDILQGPGIALSKGRSQRQSATADGGTEPGSFVPPGRAAAGDVIVNVTTAPGTAPKVSQRNEGGTRIIDVMIEQVAGRIAGDISQGRGPVPDALGASYGLKRVPR